MKANNKKNKFDSNVKTALKSRNYYFHPDEDFREDHTWGKPKSKESLNSDMPKNEDSKTRKPS